MTVWFQRPEGREARVDRARFSVRGSRRDLRSAVLLIARSSLAAMSPGRARLGVGDVVPAERRTSGGTERCLFRFRGEMTFARSGQKCRPRKARRGICAACDYALRKVRGR